MQAALRLESENEVNPVDKACNDLCPKITAQQRVIGYCTTFVIGSLLNVFSWAALVRYEVRSNI